ncbi:MAG: OmpH family outer membrane protein [Bacteroidales bacterium]|nr:OmpH family outer membrane protein [Bacteroidales bacterium]
MIKKLLFAIMLAFPMLLSAQTLKVGLVDLNTVMAAMPEMTQAQTKLQDVQKKYQDEAQKLEDEMKRLYDEFQSMPDTELPAIKERKARELQDYQQKMQNFEQSAMQDLQKMQNELMAPIVAKINQAVESVGKEGAYSLIQVKEPQLTLYYANPVVDITNDVKAKLGIK